MTPFQLWWSISKWALLIFPAAMLTTPIVCFVIDIASPWKVGEEKLTELAPGRWAACVGISSGHHRESRTIIEEDGRLYLVPGIAAVVHVDEHTVNGVSEVSAGRNRWGFWLFLGAMALFAWLTFGVTIPKLRQWWRSKTPR